MRQPAAQLLPVWLTASVVLVIWSLKAVLSYFPSLNLPERAELFTFDWRTRLALTAPALVASNLAVIYIDESSLAELNQPPGNFRWPWPRSVYGRVVRELKAEGAKAVGIDGFFWDLDNDPKQADLGGLTPDEFFAQQLQTAGNVVLETTTEDLSVRPARLHAVPGLFRTNAWRLGQDGLRAVSHDNSDRLRSVTAFVMNPQTGERLWHMGLLLAARALDLDLDKAVVQPGRILLPARHGPPQMVPLGAQNQIYIDWMIAPQRDVEIIEGPFARYYDDALRRERGEAVPDLFRDRVVLIGYAAAGGRASDWGATPLADSTPLFLSHLNVANSLLTGRFITRASPWTENALIAGLALLSAALGWRLRVSWGVAAFVVVVAGYLALAVWLFVARRYWLPVATPLGGAFVMGYVCLVSYRIVVESQDRRRMRSVFGKMVSPSVFNLLAQQPAAALSSTRRPVTIYFADVRGFTRFLEDSHARTVKQLQGRALGKRLEGDTREAPPEEALVAQGVRESLETVNLYLGEMADVIKAHDGTLDKYIGDCVMAFWGAPVPDERHAVAAVRAAIAVQRAIHARNQERLRENERRQRENIERLSAGQPAQEPLPVLRVGSALNSGVAAVGFMGSAAHLSNYTVFGREVNIASRLEGAAAADRILVTEATFAEVRRHDPALAATFLKIERMNLAGIPEPVQIYEVPWQSDLPGPGGTS